MDNRGLAATHNHDLDHFSNLHNSKRFADIMKKVKHGLKKKGSDIMSELSLVVQDDDPVILQCNTLCADIDNEISMLHKFISDKYCLKFPQLVSLFRHPIDYARVVKKIGNEVDLALVDLEAIMPSDAIISMGLSVSPTSLKLLLPEDVLEKTIEACDRAILLHASKKKVLTYVKYRTRYINSMRKVAKKYLLYAAPGPGGTGHRQLGQLTERLTVGQIKQIIVTDKISKIRYVYPSCETTTRLTSSLPFNPAQVDPQAEDVHRLGSQIQAVYIS